MNIDPASACEPVVAGLTAEDGEAENTKATLDTLG